MNARRQVIELGLVVMAISGFTGSAQAQRVAADIHIGAGPVLGTIRIGDRPYYRDDRYYGRPRRREVVVPYPNRVYVERRHGWNPRKHRNARFVVVYYDRHCGIYFDRYHRGLEEIRVLHDNDRFYWYDDYRDGRDDRYLYERRGRPGRDRDDRDRYERDRYDRWDDRRDRDYRDDRREDRGEWEHDH
ncbi:MAG: hypothetical protein ACKVZ0_16440 [Gemmatimonadales bacterium]